MANYTSPKAQQKLCELCERKTKYYTVHHLVPRSRDKMIQKVAILCKACHGMVHRLISNPELEKKYNSIELLKEHSEVSQFIRWVKKQDPHKRIKIK